MTLTITLDGTGEALGGADPQRLVDQAVAAARERSRQLRVDSAEPARAADTPALFQPDLSRR